MPGIRRLGAYSHPVDQRQNGLAAFFLQKPMAAEDLFAAVGKLLPDRLGS